ncbi:MAG: hypothetical protein AAB558_01360 [Patescibacteria group bacterium]
MKRIFGRQLSWREVVAMAVLVLAVVVLSGLDIQAWQERQLSPAQPQLVEAGPVEEALEFFPEPESNQAAFVGWVASDLSDEDNGILNLQE